MVYQRKVALFLTSVLFLLVSPVLKSYGQERESKTLTKAEKKLYPKGIVERGYFVGYLDLKIIETDPVLKIAKETAPIDRPFFLKVKRKGKGKKAAVIGEKQHIIDSTLVYALDSLTVKESIILEKKSSILNQEDIIEPTSIQSIILIERSFSVREFFSTVRTLELEPVIPNEGIVYEEDSSSEFLYIQVPNLRPDQTYKLRIIWSNEEVDTYLLTTVPSSVDQRMKQRLSPQFGAVFPVFRNGDEYFSRPSLMFGVYYQLRPIDPDIPFNSYDIVSLQRFSVLFGLTINSIAESNIREDLVGDSNILLGIGYQPFDALRISYGQMLFYELNPNRLSAESKSIGNTPYVGLTLDLRLKDLLGGVVTTLGLK